MRAEELIPYLTKFVTVTLDDFSEVSGYISNPNDFKTLDDSINMVLVNGLQNSQVPISRIIDICEAVREDTTQIPIVQESSDLVSRTNKMKKAAAFNDRLDELLDKSLSDTLEVRLPNGKVIDNSGRDGK
ncbi:MAG: hypothetical protein PUE16_01930 [Lactimicrobium massiliense]|nr:hypothetical protein [Lactimicrobium massiliense]MDD6726087.1 hypothetical protein [Lactimicrobium massiliense]